ncbi:hypothetical protein WA577_004988, partial [Blastocystis sp. JDR]
MRNLPRLESFNIHDLWKKQQLFSLTNCHHIILEDLPSLSNTDIPTNLFSHVTDVKVKNIGGLAGYFLDYFPCDANGWNGLDCSKIEKIVMMSTKLNSTLKTLILAQFVHLRVLYVGSNCCEGVEEVTIVGLRHLNEITIGENSFTKKGYKPEDGKDAGRRFCLKD